MDTGMYMAESFCSSPETITPLLLAVGRYKIKKVKKKKTKKKTLVFHDRELEEHPVSLPPWSFLKQAPFSLPVCGGLGPEARPDSPLRMDHMWHMRCLLAPHSGAGPRLRGLGQQRLPSRTPASEVGAGGREAGLDPGPATARPPAGLGGGPQQLL